MKKRKTLKIILLSLCAVLVLIVGGFLLWAGDYYHAEDAAVAVMADDSNLTSEDGMTVLAPASPTDTALIFYPGAKVEAISYLPILEKITRQCGVECILMKMPLNLAILTPMPPTAQWRRIRR